MKKYYLIGEISKLFDIPKQTLRYYEQEGILKSHKNSENGYRLYSIEDIIALTDIITYRKIGIPIKEIRNMFNTMELDNIIDIISHNEKIIKEKIKHYKKMEEKIKKRKAMSIEARENLNKYKIVNKADIKYFSITDYVDATTLKKYLSENYSYLIYIDKNLLNESKDIADVSYGLSIDNEKELKYFNEEVIELQNKEEYLNTVIKVKNNIVNNEDIENIKVWLSKNNKKINGDLIGRYLSSSYGDFLFDYYKVWIPVTEIEKRIDI